MQCPYCSFPDSAVLESRVTPNTGTMRRRRQCGKCEKRFTTYERVEGVDLTVIKKNGEHELFDREKIKKGLVKATWKRPISMEDVERVIEEVERKLRLRDSNEIKVGRLEKWYESITNWSVSHLFLRACIATFKQLKILNKRFAN